MLAILLPFGLISLSWLAIGIVMIAAPSSWQGWVKRSSVDPLKRFFMSEGMLLVGLLLVVGSAGFRGRWLWTALGALIVIKALLLLGLTDRNRRSLFALWERVPPMTHRLTGVVFVALATLLAIDTVRGPQ